MKSKHHSLLSTPILTAIAVISASSLAQANNAIAQKTGNWSDPTVWPVSGTPIDQPGKNQIDGVFIRSGFTVTVNSNVNQTFGISSMVFGATGVNGTLNIQAGADLAITGNTEVIRSSDIDNSIGTINMTGGTFSTGSLLLSGGATNDNATAIFNLSGGALTVSGATTVGYTAAAKTAGFFNVTGNAATATGTSLTVNEFGTMKFTLDATGITTLNYSGAAAFVTNSTLTIDGSSYTGGAATFTLVNAASLSGSLATINDSIIGFGPDYTTNLVFDTGNGDVLLQVSAVPEPSTWALMGLGLGVLIWRMRARRVKIS